MRASFALAVGLISLLFGAVDLHVEHSLVPVRCEREVFSAAVHPCAPLHMEEAGAATSEPACPACLDETRSIGVILPAAEVLRTSRPGVWTATSVPRLSAGARSRLGSRGPPALSA